MFEGPKVNGIKRKLTNVSQGSGSLLRKISMKSLWSEGEEEEFTSTILFCSNVYFIDMKMEHNMLPPVDIFFKKNTVWKTGQIVLEADSKDGLAYVSFYKTKRSASVWAQLKRSSKAYRRLIFRIPASVLYVSTAMTSVSYPFHENMQDETLPMFRIQKPDGATFVNRFENQMELDNFLKHYDEIDNSGGRCTSVQAVPRPFKISTHYVKHEDYHMAETWFDEERVVRCFVNSFATDGYDLWVKLTCELVETSSDKGNKSSFWEVERSFQAVSCFARDLFQWYPEEVEEIKNELLDKVDSLTLEDKLERLESFLDNLFEGYMEHKDDLMAALGEFLEVPNENASPAVRQSFLSIAQDAN